MNRPAGAVDGLLADRYRLDERLAGGGMGEVWRATDVLLDRPVAVKTLRPEHVDDEDFRARLRAEARHAARLSHPGVASVYDFGELPGSAWLVMELVDGRPLSALLREQGRLDAERALDVLQQSALALQAAHSVGLVHRDVKPGNLLVTGDGTVKVTDFGISTAAGAVPLTRTGQIVGTASYLSPEQAEGLTATPASDLYALGVVAHECLSGRPPFTADNPLAVLLAHVNATPPPLPDDVPEAVRSLVGRLLAKDPSERPASAAQVALEAAALRRELASPAPRDVTRVLPLVDPYSDEPTPGRPSLVHVPERPSTGATTRTAQRWAVRATALLLALLAVALGVRGAAGETVVVPDVAVGTPEADAAAVLVEAGLEPQTERTPSPDVPEGQVVALQPVAGTRLEAGDPVVLVVSSGPQRVRVTAAELVGLPAAEAEALLRGRGLVPQIVADGAGTAVGTVSSVDPVGELALGAQVVLHVVPPPAGPAEAVTVEEPVAREPEPAAVEDDDEDRQDEAADDAPAEVEPGPEKDGDDKDDKGDAKDAKDAKDDKDGGNGRGKDDREDDTR